MDTEELKNLISLQIKMIQERLEKLKPRMMGKTVEQFLSYQPLRNVNPNDPDDPIPWRTDPDAVLTQYERELLGEQFKNAHKAILTPLPINGGGWDVEEPMWKVLERTDTYKRIQPWLIYAATHMVMGTCTSRYKIESQMLPYVKRGTPGKMILPTAVDILPECWKRNIEKVNRSHKMVIFNEHLYFLDLENLNKVKYTSQQQLF